MINFLPQYVWALSRQYLTQLNDFCEGRWWGPCVWKGNRNGCFGKFYIVVNCSHCSLRPVLLDFTLWNSPVFFLHEFIQIGWMGLQYVCTIFNHLLTLGDKLMTNMRCTFFSEHIFSLKQCALKHEFLKLWHTTSTRRKKNQNNSSTLNSSNKWWPFTILKFPLQEQILRKRLCQRLNLTERSYSLAGEVQLVCGSGKVGGWEMQQKPGFTTPSKLPRTIHQNFPRESSTTFEAFFPPRSHKNLPQECRNFLCPTSPYSFDNQIMLSRRQTSNIVVDA